MKKRKLFILPSMTVSLVLAILFQQWDLPPATASPTASALGKFGKRVKQELKNASASLKRGRDKVITKLTNKYVEGCQKDTDCSPALICRKPNRAQHRNCVDPCSKDLENPLVCPDGSVCQHNADASDRRSCQCLAGFQDDRTTGSFNCAKICAGDVDCRDFEACGSGSSGIPVCLPTCGVRSCPRNTVCSSKSGHGYTCACKPGFYLSETGCHEPMGPTPTTPTLKWSIRRSEEKSNNDCYGKRCPKTPTAMEGDLFEFTCEIHDVFPAPTEVKITIENIDGKTVEELNTTETSGTLEEIRLSLPNINLAETEVKAHPPTRSFTYSAAYQTSTAHKNHMVKCQVAHLTKRETGFEYTAARTNPMRIFACADGRCGEILHLASKPSPGFIQRGSSLNLECKADLALLEDPDIPECTWTLERDDGRVESFSYRGSQQVDQQLDAGESGDKRKEVRRILTEDGRDCNLMVQVDLWAEGNWSCNTIAFDGRSQTSRRENGTHTILVQVFVPPKVGISPTGDGLELITEFEETESEISVDALSYGVNVDNVASSFPEDGQVEVVLLCYANGTHPQVYFTWEEVTRNSSSGERKESVLKENVPGTLLPNIAESAQSGNCLTAGLGDSGACGVANYVANLTMRIPIGIRFESFDDSGAVSNESLGKGFFSNEKVSHLITCRVHHVPRQSDLMRNDEENVGLPHDFQSYSDSLRLVIPSSAVFRVGSQKIFGHDTTVAAASATAVAVLLLAAASCLGYFLLVSRRQRRPRIPPLPAVVSDHGKMKIRWEPTSVDWNQFEQVPLQDLQMFYVDRGVFDGGDTQTPSLPAAMDSNLRLRMVTPDEEREQREMDDHIYEEIRQSRRLSSSEGQVYRALDKMPSKRLTPVPPRGSGVEGSGISLPPAADKRRQRRRRSM